MTRYATMNQNREIVSIQLSGPQALKLIKFLDMDTCLLINIKIEKAKENYDFDLRKTNEAR
ncbi:hypothetical protein BpHYR1_019897 [Brachionus plicatilis]|uniref:Uncharacterized protein n=1 Tax=Brachionus plicatilis TaxID=10195 RepID=A0A3M7T9D3_BRAPC|nr:hypothetical protein BpHYR1_019897 [Brachionus plicatilis]